MESGTIATSTVDNNDIKFTDHALIRYLERVRKLDLKLIKNTILMPDTIAKIKQANGKGKFDTVTCTIVVDNYTIITITPKQQPPKVLKKQQEKIQEPEPEIKLKRIIAYNNRLKHKKK